MSHTPAPLAVSINKAELTAHIEALIFAADRPLSTLDIAAHIHKIQDAQTTSEAQLELIQNAIEDLVARYREDCYAFEIQQVGGGWQFLTKATYHATIAHLQAEKFTRKLSSAALETLAIIAYKQPVAKHQIEAIRGVNSDYAVQKLLEKELVVIEGRAETLPGRPMLYGTSDKLLDYLGINSMDDLPKVGELLPVLELENEAQEKEAQAVVGEVQPISAEEKTAEEIEEKTTDIPTQENEDPNP